MYGGEQTQQARELARQDELRNIGIAMQVKDVFGGGGRSMAHANVRFASMMEDENLRRALGLD